jgi:hypothetical protein
MIIETGNLYWPGDDSASTPYSHITTAKFFLIKSRKYIVKGESRAVARPNYTNRKHHRMLEGYYQLKLT